MVIDKWSIEEELLLLSVMQRYGSSDWSAIARHLRNGLSKIKNVNDLSFSSQDCTLCYTQLEERLLGKGRKRGYNSPDNPIPQMISILSLEYFKLLNAKKEQEAKLVEEIKKQLHIIDEGNLTEQELDTFLSQSESAFIAENNGQQPDAEIVRKYEEQLQNYHGTGGFWIVKTETEDVEMKEPADVSPKKSTTKLPQQVPTTPQTTRISPRKLSTTPMKDESISSLLSPAKPKEFLKVKNESISSNPGSPNVDDESTLTEKPLRIKPNSASKKPKLDIEFDTLDADLNSDAYRNWRTQILVAWTKISEHRHANIFSSPVTESMAKGYKKTVRLPIDLSLLKKKIETHQIHSTSEFERYLSLMFANATMFNPREDVIHIAAQEMSHDCKAIISEYMHSLSAPVGGEAVAKRHATEVSFTRRSETPISSTNTDMDSNDTPVTSPSVTPVHTPATTPVQSKQTKQTQRRSTRSSVQSRPSHD